MHRPTNHLAILGLLAVAHANVAGQTGRAHAQTSTAAADSVSELSELKTVIAAYESQGRYAEAIPAAERMLEIVEQNLGSEDTVVARMLNQLALLYHRSGAYGEALPLYKRGLSILEQALGKEHPGVANTLNNLAALYEAQG